MFHGPSIARTQPQLKRIIGHIITLNNIYCQLISIVYSCFSSIHVLKHSEKGGNPALNDILLQPQKVWSVYISFVISTKFLSLIFKTRHNRHIYDAFNTLGVVTQTFCELSKIVSRKYTKTEITFMLGFSNWNFVRLPNALLGAHVHNFRLEFS